MSLLSAHTKVVSVPTIVHKCSVNWQYWKQKKGTVYSWTDMQTFFHIKIQHEYNVLALLMHFHGSENLTARLSSCMKLST